MYNKNNVKNEFLTPSGKIDIRKCTWKRVRKNQELYDFMIGYFDDVDETVEPAETPDASPAGIERNSFSTFLPSENSWALV